MILLVRVGSDEKPAGKEDLEDVRLSLIAGANDPDLTIVTHHALDFLYIEPNIQGTTTIVKVGSDERPASDDDIRSVQKALAQASATEHSVIVCHHNIDFVTVPNEGHFENIIVVKND